MNGEGTFTWSDGKEKIGIWKMEITRIDNIDEKYLIKLKELPELVKTVWWLNYINNYCNFIFCYLKYFFWSR